VAATAQINEHPPSFVSQYRGTSLIDMESNHSQTEC